MKANLIAVQRTWWLLVLSSLGFGGIAVVGLQDMSTHAALRELRDLDRRFDAARVSQELSELAMRAGSLPFSALRKPLAAVGLSHVRLRNGAALSPLVELHLETLQDVRAHWAPKRVSVYKAEPDAIAQALAFHLAQEPAVAGSTLRALTLQLAENSAADAGLILRAEKQRREVQALDKLRQSNDRLQSRLQELYKARLRSGVEGTVMHENLNDLFKARRDARELQAKQDVAQESLAKLSEQVADLRPRLSRTGALREPVVALAKATLVRPAPRGGGIARTLTAPKPHRAIDGEPGKRTRTDVDAATDGGKAPGATRLQATFLLRLVKRTAPVPELTRLSFEATEAAGLWNIVAPLTPKAAIATAESRLGAMNRSRRFGNLELGPWLLLQVGPLLLAGMLWLLRRRASRIGRGYNPFSRTPVELPQVGFGFNALNVVSLVPMPASAGLLCCSALLSAGHMPLLAALGSLACIAMGLWAQPAARSAIEMSAAVSRSVRPPS